MAASSSKSKPSKRYPIVTSLHSFGSSSVESDLTPILGNAHRRPAAHVQSPTVSLTESSSDNLQDFEGNAFDREQFPMNKNLSLLYTKLQLLEGEDIHDINVGNFRYPKRVRKMGPETLY